MNDQITEGMKTAMRAKDTVALGALRGLKAALQTAFINIGNTEEGKAVIAVYSHNGYAVANPSDYDKERQAQQLIRELNAAN